MGKKHREPEPEKSAFENAKAAFERAGEEDTPVMKAVELSKAADAPANPETPVPETEPPASDNVAPETPSDSDSDDADPGVPPSGVESVEADTTESDAEETPVSGSDSDPTETPVSGADDSDDGAETTEEYEDDEDDFPDDTGPEVTEMETHAMETKEITLGYHRSQPAASDTRPYETQAAKEPKAKIQFKAFDKLKDAFRVQEEQADETATAGSSRDAALRKRVMQIEDEETRNYLLDRVLPQMAWYSTKIERYRTMYFRLMAATILLGALIPAFSVGANSTAIKVIIALLGASVTAINAYIALHNYRDLWLTYQTTRETLIHTLYCYFNHAGVFSYSNMSAEDLDVLLVNVCEDTMSKEHGGWTTILQKT